MAVVGKSHIFPGLGYNYNKKKKYIFCRERSLSSSLGSRYDISGMKAVY